MSASLVLIQSGTAYCMDSMDIFQAAKYNKAARIQELIDADRRCIYLQDSNTRTPLHQAAEQGSDDAIVTILKAVPADKINEYLNQKDFWGVTPLHLAAKHGHFSAIKVLVTSGALANATDMHDETPLQEALNEYKTTTDILEYTGVLAEDALKSADSSNPVCAMYKQSKEIILYLIEHGAMFDVAFLDSESGYIKKLIQEIQEIITLRLIKERSKKIGMVLASSLHPRTGKESPLGMLPQDILYAITSLVKESENREEIDKRPQDIQDALCSMGLLVKKGEKSEKIDKECKIAPQQVQKKKSKCLVM